MKTDRIRTYSEMINLPTFQERFEYLKLTGTVGSATFGSDRWLNQLFYKNELWKKLRRDVMLRDGGFDLGIRDPNLEIRGPVYVHHMNPIEAVDIVDRSEYLLNPEFLICVSANTHQAIHYSSYDLAAKSPVERTPFDTCPWKQPNSAQRRCL